METGSAIVQAYAPGRPSFSVDFFYSEARNQQKNPTEMNVGLL